MVKRSKQLKEWTGKFGKAYTDRNYNSLADLDKLYKSLFGITRTSLNRLFLNKIDRNARILEVGCNIANQLLCLQKMGFKNLYGIEPQDYALRLSRKRTKNINILKGNIFDLPFKDKYFDIVFTSGVLIHINPKDIKKAISEIHRCSRKYIWGFEYFAEDYNEINYRGKKSLLWKTNFPKIYTDTFEDLRVKKIKFLKYRKDDNVDVMFLLKKVSRLIF
ncbi:MAG: methyltransferase domain-containing protein [Candidatus Omnitrophica bacterium]|nr:methyltransferase domain-containing protein [Candidatus Omnitrophota bacterium]